MHTAQKGETEHPPVDHHRKQTNKQAKELSKQPKNNKQKKLKTKELFCVAYILIDTQLVSSDGWVMHTAQKGESIHHRKQTSKQKN